MDGPCLDRPEAYFDAVQYIRLEKAKSLIDIILKNYDNTTIDFIKK